MEKLSNHQIDRFIYDGFVELEHAFSTKLAEQCRNILWNATQCEPNDMATWIQPVVRIGALPHDSFRKAANTPVLYNAFDQLVGKHNWLPLEKMGSFVIRFPSKVPAPDTGWHVDASFAGDGEGDYLKWRINIHSKGRALLLLFLFSNVFEQDAPTRIKKGSHLDVARILKSEGDNGLSFIELAQKIENLPEREEVFATGKAGTVYLCHPFLVHAAQDHHGTLPKFMAQPPLLRNEVHIYQELKELSPIDFAIQMVKAI